MHTEIERKFLVNSFDESISLEQIEIIQGYIQTDFKGVVRVRTWNNKAYLTIKYRISKLSREEFEYEIPYDDAVKLLKNACACTLHKTRFMIEYGGKRWEVDRFNDRALILAEIELESEMEEFQIPPFVIKEVTQDSRYSNHYLCIDGGVPSNDEK